MCDPSLQVMNTNCEQISQTICLRFLLFQDFKGLKESEKEKIRGKSEKMIVLLIKDPMALLNLSKDHLGVTRL